MTSADAVALIDVAAERPGGRPQRQEPRAATQADIDFLLG